MQLLRGAQRQRRRGAHRAAQAAPAARAGPTGPPLLVSLTRGAMSGRTQSMSIFKCRRDSAIASNYEEILLMGALPIVALSVYLD